MTARRGEVWLLDFGDPIGTEQAGRRPAVVVSDDEMNDGRSGLVIVVPITSARRGLPSHVELDDPLTGLDEISYAKCEDIKSVSEHRLITRLGAAPPAAMFAMERVLRYLLTL
ncbi:MAG: type II toxin-antitoxin system PemK/MazF family toxin [Acidimicrobiales bacterium]